MIDMMSLSTIKLDDQHDEPLDTKFTLASVERAPSSISRYVPGVPGITSSSTAVVVVVDHTGIAKSVRLDYVVDEDNNYYY